MLEFVLSRLDFALSEKDVEPAYDSLVLLSRLECSFDASTSNVEYQTLVNRTEERDL